MRVFKFHLIAWLNAICRSEGADADAQLSQAPDHHEGVYQGGG